MCADQSKCVDIPDCAEGSDEKNCNITGNTVSVVVCWNWHCWVCQEVYPLRSYSIGTIDNLLRHGLICFPAIIHPIVIYYTDANAHKY